jgi:hypothetical protein
MSRLLDYYDACFGARVQDAAGRKGTIQHVFTGSLAGAAEVHWDDGPVTIERAFTLRDGRPPRALP